jgi:uncharacterized protein
VRATIYLRRKLDLVIEDGQDRVVGIEVKASAIVRQSDLRGLRQLQDAVGLNVYFL